MRIEATEHAKFRALAQILVDKDKAKEVFDEYMAVAFPYMEATKRLDKEEAKKVLAEWVSRGALGIREVKLPTLASRMKQNVDTNKAPNTARLNRLYGRMGQTVPIRK